MQDAFAIVLFVVVGVAAVAAVWALVTSAGSYDQIGRGGMSLDERPRAESPAAERDAEIRHERDAEIRQMLEARNARRAARGEPVSDVEAELRALTAAADPEVREEVRALVESRNARRVARGEEPLDVEAEVERRLREL
jgi:hypothetical protein